MAIDSPDSANNTSGSSSRFYALLVGAVNYALDKGRMASLTVGGLKGMFGVRL
ncbi:MAG TPA: hypothetical protein VGY55_03285 [Pirellulales bacterium]|jgi:hypothetical protein|nr:hypothetical protein [Pirellulales bacterium]